MMRPKGMGMDLGISMGIVKKLVGMKGLLKGVGPE